MVMFLQHSNDSARLRGPLRTRVQLELSTAAALQTLTRAPERGTADNSAQQRFNFDLFVVRSL